MLVFKYFARQLERIFLVVIYISRQSYCISITMALILEILVFLFCKVTCISGFKYFPSYGYFIEFS